MFLLLLQYVFLYWRPNIDNAVSLHLTEIDRSRLLTIIRAVVDVYGLDGPGCMDTVTEETKPQKICTRCCPRVSESRYIFDIFNAYEIRVWSITRH